MNLKKLLLTFVGVFLAYEITGYLIHNVILMSTYASPELSGLWRPEADMQSKMWVMYITALFFSFFFTFIFSKGYENKGIMEGVRYGLYVGLMVAIPMAYNSYAVYPIPYSLALQWFLYGVVQYIILGVVAALLYKPKAAAAAAS